MPDLRDHPTTMRAGEELDLAKLEPFLRAHFPGERGPLTVQQYPSGHSNLTYAVSLGGKEFVLRRLPFGSKVKSAHDMGRECRVLSRLHGVYPPAPEVLCYCDDESVLGAPFFLMKPIRGVILRRDPPAELQFSADTAQRLSESLIDNLACLHRLDYEAIGLADLGNPQGYLERQLRGWIEPNDPEELQKIRWGPTNFPGSLTRAELVQRYTKAAARDVSNMVFYLAFARFKIAVIIQQIYFRYHLGLTNDPRFASMPELIKNLLLASLRTAETGAI